MTVHLKKLCVGVDEIAQLRSWQDRQRRLAGSADAPRPYARHLTRNFPRRADELLDGGSLYWVVRGVMQVRQRIVGLEQVLDGDARALCEIRLDPELVLVEPRRARPFQGWRYLEVGDAPPDVVVGSGDEPEMPPRMRAELRELGLL